MRAMASNHAAYGDLRPRRVRDYIPIWAGVTIALWILALIILTAIAFLFANVPLRTGWGIDHWVYLPHGRWYLIAIPLFVVLFQTLGFGLLRWMVALPRLKSLDEIPDVGVFDVHFRRESIYYVMQSCSTLMFFSFWIQWFLAIDNMPRMVIPSFILFTTMIANAIINLALIIGLFSSRMTGPQRRGSAPLTP
jgi:hypothetical protein